MHERTYRGLVVRKFSLLCFLTAVITSLIVVSLNMANHSYTSPALFAKDIHDNFASMYKSTTKGLALITHVPRNVYHSDLHVANVKAFVQPADTLPVPAITPSRNFKVPAAVPLAPGVVASAPEQPASIVLKSTSNTYAWGNCTWWAAYRRAQIGRAIPSTWGNAATWAERAAGDGYPVDHQPSPGAIMQTAYSARGLGHVAFVESVDPDGTWHISEMNVRGLGVVDQQAEPAAGAANYNFIH